MILTQEDLKKMSQQELRNLIALAREILREKDLEELRKVTSKDVSNLLLEQKR